MKKLRMGTPLMGIVLGGILLAAGVLVMLIGFWKVLILACLFGIGYFIGTIENFTEFVREKANKIIPDKTAQPINIKDEIAREQAETFTNTAVEAPAEKPAESTETEE